MNFVLKQRWKNYQQKLQKPPQRHHCTKNEVFHLCSTYEFDDLRFSRGDSETEAFNKSKSLFVGRNDILHVADSLVLY